MVKLGIIWLIFIIFKFTYDLFLSVFPYINSTLKAVCFLVYYSKFRNHINIVTCSILFPVLVPQRHHSWYHVCLESWLTRGQQPLFQQSNVKAQVMRALWEIVSAPVLVPARILIQGNLMTQGVQRKVRTTAWFWYHFPLISNFKYFKRY